MDEIVLKNPPSSYRKRFNRFLWLLIAVKGLKPANRHLWRVMDGVAFQDTETALETVLHDEGAALSTETAERLTLAITKEKHRKAANG